MSRAKASVDVTYWPQAIAAGVELRERCIVQQIVIEAGRATALLYRGPNGRDYRQPAGRVVVAGNGIGSGSANSDIAGQAAAASANNIVANAATNGGLQDGLNGNIVGRWGIER